jgi:beta-N-acetylhexosaminidase
MPNKELRKAIGQLFIMGFEGRGMNPHLKTLLEHYHVGGVILFARNVSEPVQAWELLRSMKSKDLLKGIDHEGGRVVRLPEPVTHFPPAGTIGATGSEKLARQAARLQAIELAAIGFNINFAPVLDVRTNPLNRVVGDRSYGEDPGTVGRLAAEAVRGIQEAGIAACGKHFPGHGDTREDSHETLPRVRLGEKELLARELLPFQAAVKAGVKAMMTAHVVYEGIDRDRPATLSPVIIGELLRKRLGFQGVISTDDLEMRGITDHYDAEEAAIMALKAGADLLMFCHTPERQFDAVEAIYKAVDGRIIRPERIHESVARIQALKAFTRNAAPAANVGLLMSALNQPEHKQLAASLG